MVEIIQQQPDDSSFEEILKELAFSRMVDSGLADSDAGRLLNDAELRARIAQWRK